MHITLTESRTFLGSAKSAAKIRPKCSNCASKLIQNNVKTESRTRRGKKRGQGRDPNKNLRASSRKQLARGSTLSLRGSQEAKLLLISGIAVSQYSLGKTHLLLGNKTQHKDKYGECNLSAWRGSQGESQAVR